MQPKQNDQQPRIRAMDDETTDEAFPTQTSNGAIADEHVSAGDLTPALADTSDQAAVDQDLEQLVLENNALLCALRESECRRDQIETELAETKRTLTETGGRRSAKSRTSTPSRSSQIDRSDLTRQLTQAVSRNERQEDELRKLRESYSFRIGQALVLGLVQPGKNTLLMPFRLIRLMVELLVAGRKKNAPR